MNFPTGMASLSLNETDENPVINESTENILIKNGSKWQLRKLQLK